MLLISVLWGFFLFSDLSYSYTYLPGIDRSMSLVFQFSFLCFFFRFTGDGIPGYDMYIKGGQTLDQIS